MLMSSWLKKSIAGHTISLNQKTSLAQADADQLPVNY
ncbi:hypothetical protein ACFX2I_018873 [Malus domestica]